MPPKIKRPPFEPPPPTTAGGTGYLVLYSQASGHGSPAIASGSGTMALLSSAVGHGSTIIPPDPEPGYGDYEHGYAGIPLVEGAQGNGTGYMAFFSQAVGTGTAPVTERVYTPEELLATGETLSTTVDCAPTLRNCINR